MKSNSTVNGPLTGSDTSRTTPVSGSGASLMYSRGRTCSALIRRRYRTAATLGFPSASCTAPAGMSMVSQPVNP